MRTWNAEERKMETIDPHLTGAPAEDEGIKMKYWNELMAQVVRKTGKEEILTLIKEETGIWVEAARK